MKNDLTCGVVRDLLPSYVENLLGEESKEAVERHLAGCPDCTAKKEAMSSPAAEAAEAEKEVDYLKRVKKGTDKKITLAVICTAVVLLGGAALKLFLIGTPLQVQTARAEVVRKERGYVEIYISSMGSANAYHGWQVETKDGVASIYAREVLVSRWFDSGGGNVFVNLKDDQGEPVREIWLGGPASGKLIWQNGQAISRTALELYEAKTPYLGDASALERILEILNIQTACGPYTMELQTGSRPYRWTLHFTDDGRGQMEPRMEPFAPLLMALVENVEELEWTWTDFAGEERSHVMDAEDPRTHDQAVQESVLALFRQSEVSGAVRDPLDIRAYGESPAGIQWLLNEGGVGTLLS